MNGVHSGGGLEGVQRATPLKESASAKDTEGRLHLLFVKAERVAEGSYRKRSIIAEFGVERLFGDVLKGLVAELILALVIERDDFKAGEAFEGFDEFIGGDTRGVGEGGNVFTTKSGVD
jgi:hypothetical protein